MREYVLLENGEAISDPVEFSDWAALKEHEFWQDVNRRLGTQRYEIKEVLH